MERVEELGIRKIMTRKHQSIPMCANVDLYSGLIYSMLDIPEDMYTPLFATARIAGWCAHRLEELATGNHSPRQGLWLCFICFIHQFLRYPPRIPAAD